MTRDRINTFTAFAGAALALAAAVLVAVVQVTGWRRSLPDEGAAAHLWQLLIGATLVTMAVFLATSDWRRPRRFLALLGLQLLALAIAAAPVAALGL